MIFPNWRRIVLLIGLPALPGSTAAIGDAATFSQDTLGRDLPMPRANEPNDDPAYCDDVGHEVTREMLSSAGWANTSYLGACLGRPVPGSTGGLRMYASCDDLARGGPEDAATVPCGVLFVNYGEGTWRITADQFELRETSGRPHGTKADAATDELLLKPGERAAIEVQFAGDAGLSEPVFVVWWPEERLPPGAAQSLTVAIGA